jgi:MFS family permease
VDARRYRWVVLAAGTLAQAATAACFLGIAAVTPALREHFGLDLAGVGLLVGAASAGLIPALVPWGLAADRFGERPVMTAGLVGAAAALGAAARVDDPVGAAALLALAGASGASVNAASGRAVLGWFPDGRRGLAMAVRQTSVPLGAALAAVALPPLAVTGGVPAVFAALAGATLLTAGVVAAAVREPPGAAPRAARTRAPVREVLADRALLRLGAAGMLLVVPQFVGAVLLVEVLVDRGVPAAPAAALLAATQLLGAAGRLGTGAWSDRAGSRLGPLRTVAVLVAAGFALAALVRPGPVPLLAAVLVGAGALAVSWNGLVFTAAGELAPPGRAGTAMAASNTANYVSAAATPVLGAALAQAAGWSAVLAAAAAAAAAAWVVLRGAPDTGRGHRSVTPAVPRRTNPRARGTVSPGH